MALPRTVADLNIDGPMALLLRFPRIFLALFCLAVFTPGLGTLPPLDRDESRYTQATKQMIETGDFIEIQFQKEARNKKPVGIYWMQAMSASVFSNSPFTDIWAYRLPSVVGAIVAVLLVFGIGARLYDPQTGLLAGAFLGGSLLMVGEAHIAKTDAVQLACIVAAIALIGKFYFAHRLGDPKPHFWWSVALWGAIGLAVLVKGPIGPFICFVTIITLSIWEGRWAWIWTMRPIAGFFVVAAITLPWLLAITLVTKGQFLADAWGRDFAGKVVASQEGHWGFPSYYLRLLPITFWPASLFVIPAAIYAWMTRREASTRFLVAWLVPVWIFLEFTPTKLPHYVLPLYPALALLAAAAVMASVREGSQIFAHWSVRVGAGLWAVITVALVGLMLIYVPAQYGTGAGLFIYALILPVMVAAAFAVYFLLRGDVERAATAGLVSGVVLVVATMAAAVPRLERLMLSPKAAELAASVGATANQGERLAIAGYTEPSFVFLAGTKATLADDGTAAAEFMIVTANAYALIEQSVEDAKFRQRLAEKGYSPEAVGQVSGINYSKNRETTLTLYKLRKINQ
jgi:4-amino-4-deoxy-L-arabinose transferase-like glycosyltransferase